MGFFCKVSNFVFRLAVVFLLLKSSLDIISTNEETPGVIVKRTKYFMELSREKLGVNVEYSFLRYVIFHAETLALLYAYTLFTLSSLVVFNVKCAVRPLTTLVLCAALFFHLELSSCCYFKCKDEKEVLLICGIVAGLYIIGSESAQALQVGEGQEE